MVNSYYATDAANTTHSPQETNAIPVRTTAIMPITRPAVAMPEGALFAFNFLPPTIERTKPTIANGRAANASTPNQQRTRETIPSTIPETAKPLPIFILRNLFDK